MVKDYKIYTNKDTWSNEDKMTIWEKGNFITGYDPHKWRRDNYGNEMKWDDYGNKKSNYGWGIGQINLISNGVVKNIINLQPLHWRNTSYESQSS